MRGSERDSHLTTFCRQTWTTDLARRINGDDTAPPYEKIYKLSCTQENMSSSLEYVHPALRLREPRGRERALSERPRTVSVWPAGDHDGGHYSRRS